MSYRILSIDGGGIRGLLAARLLQEIETRAGQPLHDYFHLIAGTSTGSIVAAGIATGMNCEAIAQLYLQHANDIFIKPSRRLPQQWRSLFNFWLSPRYQNTGLIRVLQETFRDRTLGTIFRPKLLIASYDTIRRKALIFRNWKPEHANLKIWEACTCSSAAPTFFPAYPIEMNGERYAAIDGGLGANNPACCGLAAALHLGVQPQDITLCSIGTGDNTRPIPLERVQMWGALDWLPSIVNVSLDAATDIYAYIARQMVNPPRYLRLQFRLDRDLTGKRLSDDLDDVSAENLQNLQEAARAYVALPHINEAIEAYFEASASPFDPA